MFINIINISSGTNLCTILIKVDQYINCRHLLKSTSCGVILGLKGDFGPQFLQQTKTNIMKTMSQVSRIRYKKLLDGHGLDFGWIRFSDTKTKRKSFF